MLKWLINLQRRRLVAGLVLGLLVSTVGLITAVSGAFSLGDLFLAAGPVIWGVTLGLTGPPRLRTRNLASVWAVFIIAVLLVILLRHLNAPVIVGAPVLIGAMAAFFTGIGYVLAWLMGSPRGRRAAIATGQGILRVLGSTIKAAIAGLVVLGAVSRSRQSPDSGDWDEHISPEQNPENPEYYSDQWHGPGSGDWRG